MTTLLWLPLAHANPMKLSYSLDCLLKITAMKKGILLKENIPKPKIFLESQTPLQQFQDAIEPQWNMRPDFFLNAYVAHLNEIYLMDDEKYYTRNGRFIDDSLVHELVHFLQVKYQNVNLSDGDESIEGEAIAIQTWFRESYFPLGKPILSNCTGWE